MQYLFDAQVYKKRRHDLMRELGSGLILIGGNQNSPLNYKDNYYPFRQDSNFLYYAGLNMPNLHLVMNCDDGKTVLFGDDVTEEQVVWTGPQPSLNELAERVGIDEVHGFEEVANYCASKKVHSLPPYRKEHHDIIAGASISASSLFLSEELIRSVIKQREIKEDREIEQMEDALRTTASMHIRVMRAAKPGIRESVLYGIADGLACANQGRLAYGAIVTRNGHILHNHEHHNILREGDLVLGDFGAENRMCYASDITRTFPVSNAFSEQQKEVYNIALESQIKAINACRSGQLFKDVHLLAARIIADGLKALGIMKGDTEEAVAAGAHALFFPHGLGHMIGLDVHDMEGLGEDLVGYDDNVKRSDLFGTAYLRLGKALKEGHVVTVEPGIYFIPTLIDSWQNQKKHHHFINYDKLAAFRSFGGVRIEDDILVTKGEPRILGPSIPKTVEDIEKLRS